MPPDKLLNEIEQARQDLMIASREAARRAEEEPVRPPATEAPPPEAPVFTDPDTIPSTAAHSIQNKPADAISTTTAETMDDSSSAPSEKVDRERLPEPQQLEEKKDTETSEYTPLDQSIKLIPRPESKSEPVANSADSNTIPPTEALIPENIPAVGPSPKIEDNSPPATSKYALSRTRNPDPFVDHLLNGIVAEDIAYLRRLLSRR